MRLSTAHVGIGATWEMSESANKALCRLAAPPWFTDLILTEIALLYWSQDPVVVCPFFADCVAARSTWTTCDRLVSWIDSLYRPDSDFCAPQQNVPAEIVYNVWQFHSFLSAEIQATVERGKPSAFAAIISETLPKAVASHTISGLHDNKSGPAKSFGGCHIFLIQASDELDTPWASC